jgi:hypothetical protein
MNPNDPTYVFWLDRKVQGAGVPSALGDFCYEATTLMLPGFLGVPGIPPTALGVIEGIADAVASFTKLIAGYVADAFGHRKLLVLIGYAPTVEGGDQRDADEDQPVRCTQLFQRQLGDWLIPRRDATP